MVVGPVAESHWDLLRDPLGAELGGSSYSVSGRPVLAGRQESDILRPAWEVLGGNSR
jgi:hypothetical protein